jgi:hypothetical protein
MRDWFLQVHKLSISHADSTTRSLLTGQSVSVYEQAAEPTEVINRPYTHSHSHARTRNATQTNRCMDRQAEAATAAEAGGQTDGYTGRGRQRQAEAGTAGHRETHACTLARMITLIARPPLCCGAAHISATRTEPDTHTHTHTSDFALTLTHTQQNTY